MSISVIAAISMGLSLVANLRYASGEHDGSVRTNIISTSSIEALLLFTASTAVLALLAPQLSTILGVSAAVFLFAVAYAVAVTLYTLAMNYLRVLFRMKAYALCTAAQSVLCLALFLVFVYGDMKSWQSAACALSVSNIVISLIVLLSIRDHLKRQFDWLGAKNNEILVLCDPWIDRCGIRRA